MVFCWKFGWLKRSKASTRSFRFMRSLSLNVRATLKSITSWPGPRNPLNGSLGTTEKLRDEVSNTAVYGLPLARVTTEAKVKFLSGCQAGDHAPLRTKRCGWAHRDRPR